VIETGNHLKQVGAPAHHTRAIAELLRRDTPDIIAPELWLPNSPDLNPVNYRIWAVLQDQVYRQSVRDVDELKQRLIDSWSSIQQTVIDEAIDWWRVRMC